jgi:hypothetical protein
MESFKEANIMSLKVVVVVGSKNEKSPGRVYRHDDYRVWGKVT